MTGNEIKTIRERQGLTQEALGELLGVSQSRIALWENEKHEPPPYLPLALLALEHRDALAALARRRELLPARPLTRPQAAEISDRLAPFLDHARRIWRDVEFEKIILEQWGDDCGTGDWLMAERVAEAGRTLLEAFADFGDLLESCEAVVRGEDTDFPLDPRNAGKGIIL